MQTSIVLAPGAEIGALEESMPTTTPLPPVRGNAFVAHDARDRLIANGYQMAASGCECLSRLSYALDAAKTSAGPGAARLQVRYAGNDLQNFTQSVAELVQSWKHLPHAQGAIAMDLELMRQGLQGCSDCLRKMSLVDDKNYVAAIFHLRAAENHLIAAGNRFEPNG